MAHKKHWSKNFEEAGVRIRVYERPGSSSIWYSVTRNGKKHRKSLKTSDRKLAEERAQALSANVRETRSTQRIRVGRRQRKRTCWDCEREWKRMVVPLEPGRPSEARQLLRTQR